MTNATVWHPACTILQYLKAVWSKLECKKCVLHKLPCIYKDVKRQSGSWSKQKEKKILNGTLIGVKSASGQYNSKFKIKISSIPIASISFEFLVKHLRSYGKKGLSFITVYVRLLVI